MMTPIQNAEALQKALHGGRGELDRWLEVNDEAECREALKMLLKMQDRDTRHACAEAVSKSCCDGQCDAHQACMNSQAV